MLVWFKHDFIKRANLNKTIIQSVCGMSVYTSSTVTLLSSNLNFLINVQYICSIDTQKFTQEFKTCVPLDVVFS